MNSIHVWALMGLGLLSCALADPNELVGKYCRLDKKAPGLKKLSDAKPIIELLKEQSSIECPTEVRAAILALEPVISLESVCSAAAADAIVDFWAKYIFRKSKAKAHLPKQLRRLFLGFGLQVSKVCKQTTVEKLDEATREHKVTQQDVHVVSRHLRESKKIEKIFGKHPKIEDLMIVVRTNANRNAKGEREPRIKVNMPPKHKKYFELIQERCLNKFKPIYDSLVLPIVRLAAIGLNYRGESVANFDSFMSDSHPEWFDVILACEPVARHEAVLIPANKLDADGNKAVITFLDEQDLAELREKTGLTLSDDDAKIEELADYKFEAKLDDLIVDEEDAVLIDLIDHYGKGFAAATKLRMSLIRRFPSIMKLMVKNKSVQFGLEPAETIQDGKLVKFGASNVDTWEMRLRILFKYTCLIGVAALAVALLSLSFTPIWPVWVIIGGVVVAIMIGFMMLEMSSNPSWWLYVHS